jgi:alpha-tubulin suppressor-like RCC1 family protein
MRGQKRDRDALVPDTYTILCASIQQLGGDAELEEALERFQDGREETSDHIVQACTRLARTLAVTFAALPAMERGPFELFKDAVAAYLDTQPSDVYHAYTFGAGKEGQLGHGPHVDLSVPLQLTWAPEVAVISCGNDHTGMVTRDGRVYVFGKSAHPQLLAGLPEIASISCGQQHTGLLTRAGRVYTFGHNQCGQLGRGKQEACFDPVHLEDLPAAIAISCGGYHTGVVTRDGSVYMFGFNGNGQLGNGSYTGSNVPCRVDELADAIAISCGAFNTGVVTRDGRAHVFGAGRNGAQGEGRRPRVLSIDAEICAISCGFFHTGVLARDGAVYMFGENTYGQAGHLRRVEVTTPWKIPNLPAVASISCGQRHTGLVTRDGRAYTFGATARGALGRGDPDHIAGPLAVIETLSNAVAISCGSAYTGVITKTAVPRFPFNISVDE